MWKPDGRGGGGGGGGGGGVGGGGDGGGGRGGGVCVCMREEKRQRLKRLRLSLPVSSMPAVLFGSLVSPVLSRASPGFPVTPPYSHPTRLTLSCGSLAFFDLTQANPVCCAQAAQVFIF